VVDAVKYPPAGRRGAAFGIAHDDYRAGDVHEKMASANREVLLIAQIETRAGLERVDEIASVEGIDVLWVGQFDLTSSLGIAGRFGDPAYLEALDRVAEAVRRHERAGGFMVTSRQEAEMVIGKGFRAIAYGGDLWIYQQALQAGLDTVREVGMQAAASR
jgi:2-dehydro-3-deoxyglucarate aldolase/4-hydroxy-2-oxoheptanedioate aldolase